MISQYDSSTQLFFIVQGSFKVSLLKTALDPEEEEEQEPMSAHRSLHVYNLADNDVFGEIAFVFNVLQPFTVTAEAVSRVLYLNLEAYSKIRESDPLSIRLVENEIHECVACCCRRVY